MNIIDKTEEILDQVFSDVQPSKKINIEKNYSRNSFNELRNSTIQKSIG